jgi:hypothetical protein
MSYTRCFVVDLDEYSEFRQDDYAYFNSHFPMIDTYRAMLARWKGMSGRYALIETSWLFEEHPEEQLPLSMATARVQQPRDYAG